MMLASWALTEPTLAWAIALLADDAELTALVGSRIYQLRNPNQIITPFVLLSAPYGRPARALGATRIFQHVRFDVKAVGQTIDRAVLPALVQRFDAVLNGTRGENDEVRVISCENQEELGPYPDQDQFWHHGLTFQAEVRPALVAEP